MRNIIIDCDPGIDDTLALILALSDLEFNILGIVAVAGNLPIHTTTRNILRILTLMDRLDVPVIAGYGNPIERDPVSASEVHGDDGLGNVDLKENPSIRIENIEVEAFYHNILCQYEDVEIITLGPLTNIAKTMMYYPTIFEAAKSLVAMGGAFDVPGNSSPVAEYNIWADPHAAKMVFKGFSKPITCVGLDVTRKTLLTPNYMKFIETAGNPIGTFINEALQFYLEFHWQHNRVMGCEMHDPLAVAIALYENIGKVYQADVDVICEGDAIGQTIAHKNSQGNISIVYQVDRKKFLELLIGNIFPQLKEDLAGMIGNPIYGVF